MDFKEVEERDLDIERMEFSDINPVLNTPDDCLEYWNNSFKKDKLSCLHFREWWRQKVPKYFSPKPSMNYQKPNEHIEEEDVHRNFFGLLERFLCEGDPDVVFKQLEALNNPPSQCGKVFKVGELSYSCRDCALDSTCVLCVNCFKNSEHGTHRYKMSTSQGGGYCDCGDPEAWKQFPSCTVHVLGNQSENSDCLRKLPLGIRLRARQVFTSVLKYAFELLTLDTMMKLPGDLQYKERATLDPMEELLEDEDIYATVLYNDEVHTFEEVIMTLQRAVDCDRNQAVSFVSLIDREGRCIVKCGQFQACSEVRRLVERITGRRSVKPLQAKVTHSHVVAHQIFALRLIEWLDTVLGHSEGFRTLFAKILVEQESGPNGRKQPSILEGMFQNDTVLWKAARAAVHHLLITGMLMENVSKKEFATIFTNNYGAIVKDFIQDDHDHSFSVTSLSVQLFTVPTLAQYLISSQDVLGKILGTFISECQRKKNDKGKLEFERNTPTPFRRTHYVLNDLRYLLSVPPEEFDDNSRRGFLHGYSMLLDILSWMHGMDCHVRQVNQHIEFEADWENGFNLYIKLAPVISLVIKWCSLDRVVFIKAVRMVLKRIQVEAEAEGSARVPCSVEGRFNSDVIDYSVAAKPVSMHYPLTRLLAGLALHMSKFSIGWNSIEVEDCVRPVLDEILEIPLRTTAMVSQVYAGMWRRNGYSLNHQIYFYHNARFRGEMYDRDIQLLQFCGANLEPNQFLLHALHKFGLSNWASKACELSEDESLRHMTLMVDEFFALLITIIGERHVPGVGDVTEDQMVRKEIIQLLCVEPMSNSALNKALPEDVNHVTGLDKVIDQVATFSKPTNNTGKGVYQLKEDFYADYDVFFYHYTREDQSKSEEVQRARLKAADRPQVVPPPTLPGLKTNFKGLLNVLQCELMLYLMKLVLDRADDLQSKCFSEDQVHRVLYLIGMGIMEEERMNAQTIQHFDDVYFKFTSRAKDVGLVESLNKLAGSNRIESHKELLNWVTRRLKKSLGLVQEKPEDKKVAEVKVEKDSDEKAKKAAAAAQRRSKIMQQMAAQQNTFMKENSKLFDETPSGLREHKASISEWEMEVETSFPVCLGPKRSQQSQINSTYTCILCQEEEELKSDSRTLVTASFIQKSTVLARNRKGLKENKDEFPYLRNDLHSAPHTSSCGHVMHSDCWKKYFDDIAETERRRYSRSRHPASFDVDKSEFLCPLCRSLSNSVMTLIPQYNELQQPKAYDPEALSEAEAGLSAVVQQCIPMETTEELRTEVLVSEAVSTTQPNESGAMEVSVSPDVSQGPSQPSQPIHGEGVPVSEVVEGRMELESQPVVAQAIETLVAEVISQAQNSLTQEVPASSSSSSSSSSISTEMGSSGSLSSDSTFMSADESPAKGANRVVSRTNSSSNTQSPANEASKSSDSSKTGNLDVNISYAQWLEALFVALKYKKSLSPDKMDKNGGESEPQDEEMPARTTSLSRYYTCPLDQVVSELESAHHDGRSFARLFSVAEGGELAFPSSVYEIMNTFCQTTYSIGLGEVPHVLDEMIPLMVWQSCAFTVISIVVSAMDMEKPVLGSLSSRQNDCLTTLIRFCGVVGSNFGEPKVIRSHSLKLLSTILEVDTNNPSILEVDMFGLLVGLTYSLPSLFNGEAAAPLPSCNIQDLHILRLLFTAHIVQLLFSLKELQDTEVNVESCFSATDCQILLDILHTVQEPQHETLKYDHINPVHLWQKIMVRSLGFLRCCALFYQYLSGVLAPTELNSMIPPDQEFLLLCRYLSLPSSPRLLLNSDYSLGLVRKWSNHPNIHIMLSEPESVTPSFVYKVPKLLDLNEEYSELINSVSSFTCPRAIGDESRAPSMCLVCGEVVCSQSYCCQGELDGQSVGACTAHAHSCGAGSGVFLRVRECKIIMLAGRSRGCFVSPPYLDQYGETDQGLKRGNRLTLCTQRYKKLERIWLNHGIPEEVTHNLESATGYVTTDWIHL